MPTTRYLSANDLHDIVRGMAVVSKLHDPDPDTRFKLDPAASGVGLGAWKDFDGNECHFLFSPDGAVLLGFDHASPMSPHATTAETGDFTTWPGIYDNMPEKLMARLTGDLPWDDAFDYREVTLALWLVGSGREWTKGTIKYPPRDNKDPDGQAYLLAAIKAYEVDFPGEFEKQYNWDLDPDAVADLLSGDKISMTCIKAMKSDANLPEVRKWLPEMGFVVDAASK